MFYGDLCEDFHNISLGSFFDMLICYSLNIYTLHESA